MSHVKNAAPDYPVQEVITRRWSPYLYSERPVSLQDVRAVFEAARWAASAYNEQPWRYIVATKDNAEEYEKLLSCLVEPNQAWARNAPVLALGIARLTYSQNDKPNGTALHDLGLASANLTLEATARGLYAHQMGGILPDRARELYGVPDGYQVLTALALGYPGEGDGPLAERDAAPRSRKPQAEFVFAGEFGKAF
jgi:nitroreductase